MVKAGLYCCVSVRGHTGGEVGGMEVGALYALLEIKPRQAGAVLGSEGRRVANPGAHRGQPGCCVALKIMVTNRLDQAW